MSDACAWSRGYKTVLMLNSTEHGTSNAHKSKMLIYIDFFALIISYVVFILLINVKMPTIVGILTFMSRINFVLSCVEHGKSFITSSQSSSLPSSCCLVLVCDCRIPWFESLEYCG